MENNDRRETAEDYYERQIELRDKLIIRLIAEAEPLCDECALQPVCCGGAKFEACKAGLLAKFVEGTNQ